MNNKFDGRMLFEGGKVKNGLASRAAKAAFEDMRQDKDFFEIINGQKIHKIYNEDILATDE